jgi:hypothetical protein
MKEIKLYEPYTAAFIILVGLLFISPLPSVILNRIIPRPVTLTDVLLLLLFPYPLLFRFFKPRKAATPTPVVPVNSTVLSAVPLSSTIESTITSQSVKIQQPTTGNNSELETLRIMYMELLTMQPHQRGYAFQRFLNDLFATYHLSPRNAFRLTGEEIDGSFDIESQTYLLEAKWHNKPSSQSDLLVFNGKIEGKSTWARGIFISYNGFTEEGMEAFARGKRTSIIGMDGKDLLFILEGRISLVDAIKRKSRSAVETNSFFVPVQNLI